MSSHTQYHTRTAVFSFISLNGITYGVIATNETEAMVLAFLHYGHPLFVRV